MIIAATEELTIWRIYNPDVVKEEMYAYAYKDEKIMSPVNKENDKPVGGMQHGEDQGKLCGDVMEEKELKRQLEESNGSVSAIIEKIVSTLIAQKKAGNVDTKNKIQELENKSEQAIRFNSEHSISASNNPIPIKDSHYQCFYPIKLGLSYELKDKFGRFNYSKRKRMKY
ncbi:hypothetical protein RFI_05990 [Reticulomyxa filosa]|uniref:Uncharacterized protein n=1 Tax=Reticulomyxa filosa TaxID=46433 RepID=X6P0S1_RETFI|nr:hypothetical protein RFI_05990 [Reticulomyxa filosa]|eukprot:ETO31132.1 hypothetical protein RFI_05990 [Reticulomyxa filosa]